MGETPEASSACSYHSGQRVAHRLLDHRLAADPLDHHLRRHLALAKAGHLHLAGEVAGRAIDAL